ncbi:MAG: AAA family ATPase [Sphaerochaetaceae bacterium]|nr:AAA family ATPase [Sphaerochaetaceae bacterium]
MQENSLFTNDDTHSQPLAARMRPRNLEEYIGQDHIVGKGRLLRRAIQADQLSSVIFYGPPGTGKTTLARVIANTTKSHFTTLNAVLSGVKELREEIERAKDRRDFYQVKTILFIDEVHRWNKSQQDALLPWVENGTFILIGATTENPFFEVNAALVSRSRIFQLKTLKDEDLYKIAWQALKDKERGYGDFQISFEEGALEHLIDVAKGDARSLLNALQLAVETSVDKFPPPINSKILITKEAAEESIQQKAVLYDKEGDYHYDVISAFIKSIRGSDPDATLYWLAKMVSAGEDPRFIFRRMLISAAEDIGLADPQAVAVVSSDATAFDRIGLPEGRFHLTHAALYLSTCEKSNSTLSFFDALKTVEKEKQDSEVPNHLRDASRDSDGFGHGEGYLYPHAYKDHFVAQQYLPTTLQGKIFYNPGELGYENKIKNKVLSRREAQLEASLEDAFVENLTYSPNDKAREKWLKRTTSERGILLEKIKNTLYDKLVLKRSDRVLILGAGHGLLLWQAFRETPEGYVCAQVDNKEQYDYINHYASKLDELNKPYIKRDSIENYIKNLDNDLKFEHVIIRNQFSNYSNVDYLFNLIESKRSKDGDIIIAQTIPREGSRLSSFIINPEIKNLIFKCEQTIYKHNKKGLCGWDNEDLIELLNKKNFIIDSTILSQKELRFINPTDINRWIDRTYSPTLEKLHIPFDKDNIIKTLTAELGNKSINWYHKVAIIKLSKTEPKTKLKKENKGEKEWKEIHKKIK